MGFHHLVLAECVLKQFREITKIIFILSNGMHPDPTKTQMILGKELRLTLLESMILDFSTPEQSIAARLALDHQEPPLLTPENASVSKMEFEQAHPFRMINHLNYIQRHTALGTSTQGTRVIVGADLFQRMLNPDIFSDADLMQLEKRCEFISISRDGNEVESMIEAVWERRHVRLSTLVIQMPQVPLYLRPFLSLSSTVIRRAIQSGQGLEYFVPQTAAHLIETQKLYQHSSLTTDLNEWEHQCWKQQQLLESMAAQVMTLLDQRAQQGKSHTIAFLETSTGGRISSCFSALPGISKHFIESSIAYSQSAKKRLLQNTSSEFVAVSETTSVQLARQFQIRSGADFVFTETGMAGPPNSQRKSTKNGQCYFSFATVNRVTTLFHQAHPFLDKKEHQLVFGIIGLEWILKEIALED